MTYIITTRKILLINYVGLNNCPPKVKLTIESNPLRFLDTEIINNNGVIETRVHRRKTKLATLWTSNIPTRFKWFTIKAELYQAKHVSSNFTNKQVFLCALLIVNIHELTTAQTNEDIEFIIPPWVFEVKMKIVIVEIPYCLKNECSGIHL